MPPTRAAATNTACGRCAAIHASTAGARRRSQSRRTTVRISHPSAASRRASAAPTRPRWPATQTRLFRSAYGKFACVVRRRAAPQRTPVGLDHFGDQRVEAGAMTPAELLACLCGVAEQQIDLGGTVIAWVDRHQAFAGARAQAVLLRARTRPYDRAVDACEGALDEFAHGVRLAGGEDVVVGLVLLQDQPHALDVVARVAPVALRVDIAEVEPLLQTALDGRDRAGDLAGDEGFAPHGRFVVEEDAVRGVQPVGLAVIDGDPVGVELGHGIGAAR